MEQSLGQIAYNAYAESVGWQSFNGGTLPPYIHQTARVQDAWEAAGDAVAKYLEGAES
jgi:hypothetical protein